MTYVAGIDVGGTNIAVGIVDEDHEVVAGVEVATPADGPAAVVEAAVAAVRSLDPAPLAVGLGAPGPVRDGVLVAAPNLAGFTAPADLAAMVGAALDLPTVLGNDATLGTLGESVAGAGRGIRHLLGVWVGTGIGGGLVLDGRPYDGAFGAAGEFGHLVVHMGGALCGCGRRGCVEAYAGRRAMERAAAVARDAGSETELFAIMADKGRDRLTSGIWRRALDDDDPVAVAVVDEAVAALGVAIGSAVNLLDVDGVVVGGGFAEKLGQGYADRLREAAEPWMISGHGQRRFVVAALGDHAGIVGAAAFARSLLD